MCDGCKKGDCGKCKFCLDMPRFGGPGKKKRRCENRKGTGTHNMLTCVLLFTRKLRYDSHPQEYSSLKEHSQLNNSLQSTVDASKGYLPDENCLFRVLSQQLSGFEELHQTLRDLLVKFIFCNLDSFHCRVTSGTIQSHLQNMQRNAQWGVPMLKSRQQLHCFKCQYMLLLTL